MNKPKNADSDITIILSTLLKINKFNNAETLNKRMANLKIIDNIQDEEEEEVLERELGINRIRLAFDPVFEKIKKKKDLWNNLLNNDAIEEQVQCFNTHGILIPQDPNFYKDWEEVNKIILEDEFGD